MLDEAGKVLTDEASRDEIAFLRDKPAPRRHHWVHFTRKWGQLPEETIESFHEAYRAAARDLALSTGLLSPDAQVLLAKPDLRHFVAFDGKVMSALSRFQDNEVPDRRTGEIRTVRVDPASGWHAEAGDERNVQWGSKWVMACVRGTNRYHSRVVLDVRYQPPGGGYGGEAGIITEMATALHEHLPGMHGVLTDGVLRAKHIDPLARRGLLVVSPVIAQSNPSGRRDAPDRVEKSAQLRTYVGSGNGRCEHNLYAVGRAVCEKFLDADGQETYERLDLLRVDRAPGKRSCRWYHEVLIPCEINGSHPVRVNVLDNWPGDAMIDNRSEYLRQFPPGDTRYQAAYGRRNDAESNNQDFEQSFKLNRLPAYGSRRQLLIMLLAAHAANSVTQHLWQRQHAPGEDPPAARAA